MELYQLLVPDSITQHAPQNHMTLIVLNLQPVISNLSFYILLVSVFFFFWFCVCSVHVAVWFIYPYCCDQPLDILWFFAIVLVFMFVHCVCFLYNVKLYLMKRKIFFGISYLFYVFLFFTHCVIFLDKIYSVI